MVECTIDKDKECLPDIIECEDFLKINTYMDSLYINVFRHDFILNTPQFNGVKVIIRKEPMDGNKEHGFIHMTHEDFSHKSKDPNDRTPDFRRCERLPWVRPIIENYECAMKNACGKILYWEELFRGYVRVHLLYEDERFLVVLERRNDVYMIITSFYLNKDWELEKRKQKYLRYQTQKTPLV